MTKSYRGENWKENPLENTDMVMGSGDFLADCGYENPDEIRMKFALSNEIARFVERHGLRQAEVCVKTGLKQPDVSKIVNGVVAGYSVYRLMKTLNDLGGRVTVLVEKEDDEEEARSFAMSL